MAKARTKASVRDRAIAAWFTATKIAKDDPHLGVVSSKARSRETVTVKCVTYGYPLTWSYAGGKLRRLSASEAAGQTGLSACISGEYA